MLKPRGLIKKANLIFAAKSIWILVHHYLSPIGADNIITWDRAVLVVAMVAGFEVDFSRLLLAGIHERAFKAATTYPFPHMIFELCRSAGVPIWHIYVLKTPSGTVDIGLIRDEANEMAPNRGLIIEVQALGENLANTVEQDQGVDKATSDPTNTTPFESIPGTSRAPSSSRSTPSVALVPIARVQKLEA